MKRLLQVGLVLCVFGIVAGGLFLAGGDVSNPDQPSAGDDGTDSDQPSAGDGGTDPDRLEEEKKEEDEEVVPGADLHVELTNKSGELDGPVIDYAELTPDQQAFFEQAVSDDDRFGTPIPDNINSSVWYDNWFVRYQNRTYRVSVSET